MVSEVFEVYQEVICGGGARAFPKQEQEQDITDEEINLLAKAYSTMEGELNAPAFARAILRKAQEK